MIVITKTTIPPPKTDKISYPFHRIHQKVKPTKKNYLTTPRAHQKLKRAEGFTVFYTFLNRNVFFGLPLPRAE